MVTDRDRSVVAWVAVIGAVSAQDVMARFGVGRTSDAAFEAVSDLPGVGGITNRIVVVTAG